MMTVCRVRRRPDRRWNSRTVNDSHRRQGGCTTATTEPCQDQMRVSRVGVVVVTKCHGFARNRRARVSAVGPGPGRPARWPRSQPEPDHGCTNDAPRAFGINRQTRTARARIRRAGRARRCHAECSAVRPEVCHRCSERRCTAAAVRAAVRIMMVCGDAGGHAAQ